jgi:uncharacterized membrane protein YfcA
MPDLVGNFVRDKNIDPMVRPVGLRRRVENIHLANALKVILTAAFNMLAVVIFLAVGKIYWAAALIVGAAAIVGGYGGAWVAQRLPAVWVRGFVIVVGATMTIYFFLRIK